MELFQVRVYENERRNIFSHKWDACPRVKLDPEHYTDKGKSVCFPLMLKLPSSQWTWIDNQWTTNKWQYAKVQFSNGFTVKYNSKLHFVRRKLWTRRRIKGSSHAVGSEVLEYAFENKRNLFGYTWKSPFMPGDRAAYTDENGNKHISKSSIESALPIGWQWKEKEWWIEIGMHTDHHGWTYAIGIFINTYTINY